MTTVPKSTFYSSAPSSENQDRTTVPRVRFTVLPPLQRIRTGPQSPEYVLQFCPLFRESEQDHSPQSTFYSSAPSSENQERAPVPRVRSTVPHPLQTSRNAAVAQCGSTPQEQLCGNTEELVKTTTFTQSHRSV